MRGGTAREARLAASVASPSLQRAFRTTTDVARGAAYDTLADAAPKRRAPRSTARRGAAPRTRVDRVRQQRPAAPTHELLRKAEPPRAAGCEHHAGDVRGYVLPIASCSNYTQPVTQVRLGLAHADDAAAIASMSRQLIEHGLAWSWNEDRIERCLRNRDCVVLAARDRRRLVGFAIMEFYAIHAHLNLLAVQPGHQRQGIGGNCSNGSSRRRAPPASSPCISSCAPTTTARRRSTRSSAIRATWAQSRVLRRPRGRGADDARSDSHDYVACGAAKNDERAARAEAAARSGAHGVRHAQRSDRQVRRVARRAPARRGPRARRESDRARRHLRDSRDRLAWIADAQVEVVVTTGGTGITGRDGTPEAIAVLLDKEIDGFGELFRTISYDEIGASSLQSRCLAGVANATYIFCSAGLVGRLCDRLGQADRAAARLSHAALQSRGADAAPQRVVRPRISSRSSAARCSSSPSSRCR